MRISGEEYRKIFSKISLAYSDSSFKNYFDKKYELVLLLNGHPQTFSDFDCKAPVGKYEDGTNVQIGTYNLWIRQ